MNKFLVVDLYNLFFRALYTLKLGETEYYNGMLTHSMFQMLEDACNLFKPDHIVLCVDGNGSWRYKIYPKYKQNRIEQKQKRTFSEIERDEITIKYLKEELIPFFKNNTNMTVLEYENAEADDLIARFIKLHSDSMNIILTTDNDFIQLLNENVVIYNSMEKRVITNKVIYDSETNKPIKFTIKNGKVSVSKTDNIVNKVDEIVPMKDWVGYALFSKCIRGDVADNIFSAYPRVREKSSKKAIGLLEAYESKKENGYAWDSFKNVEWKDPLDNTHRVEDEYLFNEMLVDMDKIPNEYKESFDKYILNEQGKKNIHNLWFNIQQFMKKMRLERLLESPDIIVDYFSRCYPL